MRSARILAAGFAVAVAMAATVASADIFYYPTQEHAYRHFRVTVASVTRDDTLKFPDRTEAPAPIGPGIWLVANVDFALFRNGRRPRIAGFERLVEDSDPAPLLDRLARMSQVHDFGLFLPNIPFEFDARPGEKLIFMTMFLQSNDLFYAPKKSGLVLFDFHGRPLEGDVTDRILLWDGGTEVNQPPGRGDFQAAREAKLDYGTIEGGVVRPVDDGFTYPRTADVIDVEIAAGPPIERYRNYYVPFMVRTAPDETAPGNMAPAPASPPPASPTSRYITIGN
jgi:hypothetical protein